MNININIYVSYRYDDDDEVKCAYFSRSKSIELVQRLIANLKKFAQNMLTKACSSKRTKCICICLLKKAAEVAPIIALAGGDFQDLMMCTREADEDESSVAQNHCQPNRSIDQISLTALGHMAYATGVKNAGLL